ncbi:MAG: hypothetical protein DMF51_11090 [Acidobacteria bacterium]|nr:MAG: hypothetical protein DMF51_11090 [Acidobacteriota bacterium]
MNPKRLVPAAFALLALPVFVTDSQAQPRRRWAGGFREGYEFTVSVNLDSFEDKMELDDDTGAGVRFGYLFNPNHEIEFMYNGITANDRFFSGESAHIGNTQVSYVFNFTTHGVVPYVTAGLGWVHTNDTDLGSETDPVWSLRQRHGLRQRRKLRVHGSGVRVRLALPGALMRRRPPRLRTRSQLM